MSFVVVGIDGSECSYNALVAAVEQAKPVNAEVRVMNVVVLPALTGYEYGAVDIDAMKQAARTSLEVAIDRLTVEYGGSLPVEVSSDISIGHVGIELLRCAAQDEGARMVIVGSRGFGAFKSLLSGSVTTYLAHHLQCPMLIIPASDQPAADA